MAARRILYSIVAGVLVLIGNGARAQEAYVAGDLNHFTDVGYLNELVQGAKVYGTFDVGIGWKTAGADAAMFKHPRVGVGLSYATLGSVQCTPGSRMGDAFSLYGFFMRDLVQAGWFSAGYDIELGLALMTHPYDKYDNPLNVVYGGPLTFHTKGGIYAMARVSERLSLEIEGTYRHNSSCRLFIPNRGVNAYGCSVSARYSFGSRTLEPGRGPAASPSLPLNSPWRVSLFAAGGLHKCNAEYYADQLLPPQERSDPYTPWFKGSAGLEATWRYCRRTSTALQLEVHYIANTERLKYCDLRMYGRQEPEYSPWAPGIGFVQEIYLGPFTAGAGAGVYLWRRVGIHENHSNFYQKVFLRYYPPAIRSWFFGISMRAHTFDRADYIEFCVGKVLFSR